MVLSGKHVRWIHIWFIALAVTQNVVCGETANGTREETPSQRPEKEVDSKQEESQDQGQDQDQGQGQGQPADTNDRQQECTKDSSSKDSCDELNEQLQVFVDRFDEVESKQTRLMGQVLQQQQQQQLESKSYSNAQRTSGDNNNNQEVDGPLHHLKLLPKGYDKRQLPPAVNEGEVNEISITMDIYSIPQLDEKKEEIMVEVRLSHFWYDLRLTDTLTKPVELVPEAIVDFWTPDSYFHHAKDAEAVSLIKKPASLRITPNKMLKYTMMTMVTIGCPMQFHSYPMDQQTCRLELQSFGYSLRFNNYTWRRAPIMKEDILLDNHNVKIEQYSFAYKSDGLQYPGLGIRLELKRHLGYHLIQTYVPSIIYVSVAWLSFLVPSDVVPGRMVLCVTTLLTLTSMFNAVRGLTPQASYMKAVDLWVFACMLFVFSSLAEYGVILHLTSRSAWQKRVDAHVRGLTGKRTLKTVTPVELLSISLRSNRIDDERRTAHEHPDMNTPDLKESDRRLTQPISMTSPQVARDPALPNRKERLAYTIEWAIKIAYPLAFLIFNVAYWGYYLGDYSSQPKV